MFISRFIISWARNYQVSKLLNRAYKDDEIIAKLSHTFGVQFNQDWIGRLYAVINPAIRDGKFYPEQTFEYTEKGYDTQEYVKSWTMERLMAMDNFLKTNNLFDMLTYDLRKLDDYGNHLFILSPITLPQTLQRSTAAIIEFILLLVAGGFIWLNWGNILSWFG